MSRSSHRYFAAGSWRRFFIEALLLLAAALCNVSAQTALAADKEEIALELRGDRVCFDNQTADFESPYTVQKGDTFASIAQKYFADPRYAETIAKANRRAVDSPLQPNAYLRIPVRRFCMRFDPEQADYQRRQIDAFVAATSSRHKLTYSWAGKLDLPGGTVTLEDLINRAFVPTRFVINWMDNDKVGLSLSFVAGSWLEAQGGNLTIDRVSPVGIRLAVSQGAGETEEFIRRSPKEFLEEYRELEKTDQTADMRKLVSREAPVVFETVYDLLTTSLQYREAGAASAADDNIRTAESMAEFFPTELGQAGMRALVRTFTGWSPAQLAERKRAVARLTAGKQAVKQGQLNAALVALGEARVLFHRLGDRPAEYNAHVQLADAYKLADDYEKMQETVTTARKLALSYGDISNGARLLGIYGFAFALRENYAEALKVLEDALTEFQRVRLTNREASIHVYLSIVYKRMGDYDNALYHNQRAFLIAQHARRWGQSSESERDILGEQADLYTLMRDYNKALEICDKLIAVAEKESDMTLTLNASYRKGVIYQLMGRDDEAIALFSFVLKRGEQISQPPKGSLLSLLDIRHKWEDEGKVLAYMGRSYYHKADYNKAVRQFHEGLTYYDEKKDIFGIIELNYWLGLTYIKQGFPDDAIRRFEVARDESQRIGVREQDWEISYGIAQAHLAAGRLREALKYFSLADKVIDRKFATRSWYAEESVHSAVDVKRDFYMHYADLLLALNSQYPAQGYDQELFTVAEKAKSIVFQESIAKASANNTLGQTAEFRRQLTAERMMISRVSQLASQAAKGMQIRESDSQPMGQSTDERLLEAESALAARQRSLEREFPRYADLVRPKSLTVKDLQSVMKENETVLSYLVRPKDTIVFVIGKNSFHAIALPIGRNELDKLVEQFHIGIDRIMTSDGMKSMSDDPGDLAQFDPRVAHELYEKLFQQAEAWIPKRHSKLFIAADGTLYTLPFEALVDKAVDMKRFLQIAQESRTGKLPFLSQYARLHYLIDTFTIAYLPAASVLRSLRLHFKPTPRSGREPLIAFADPVFESADGDSEPSIAAQFPQRRSLDIYLPRLRGSESEARQISKLLGGHERYVLLRDKASEANVHDLPLSKARYLLFSTHGLLSGDYQGEIHEPALVLSLAGNPPEYDGLLSASEVYGLDLDADAVILSACNTYGADGAAGNGEGFAGFTRAFMYAGASSLLVSHWEVEADATRLLLVDTFRQKRGTLVDALRNARLIMRHESRPMPLAPTIRLSMSHPFFWASFVYVGQ